MDALNASVDLLKSQLFQCKSKEQIRLDIIKALINILGGISLYY